jgi:hypothetical protein
MVKGLFAQTSDQAAAEEAGDVCGAFMASTRFNFRTGGFAKEVEGKGNCHCLSTLLHETDS